MVQRIVVGFIGGALIVLSVFVDGNTFTFTDPPASGASWTILSAGAVAALFSLVRIRTLMALGAGGAAAILSADIVDAARAGTFQVTAQLVILAVGILATLAATIGARTNRVAIAADEVSVTTVEEEPATPVVPAPSGSSRGRGRRRGRRGRATGVRRERHLGRRDTRHLGRLASLTSDRAHAREMPPWVRSFGARAPGPERYARLMAPLPDDVLDRAVGAVLGLACGDALGAPFEFGPPLDPDVRVAMIGGGPFNSEVGEWTDDTAMTIPILRAAQGGADLEAEPALDAIVGAWIDWARTAPDVGNQTRAVLSACEPTAASAETEAQVFHLEHGRSAGNGSLMRTGPVALPYLLDETPERVARVARRIGGLTHWEADAGDGCVLWSVAIWGAIRTGHVSLADALAWLPDERRDTWRARIADATGARPRDFAEGNGWVVRSVQGAWAAMTSAGCTDGGTVSADQLRAGIDAAVRGGRDTDTVAAIAGTLLGAAAGASALPAEWTDPLHGWPGIDARELTALAVTAVSHQD